MAKALQYGLTVCSPEFKLKTTNKFFLFLPMLPLEEESSRTVSALQASSHALRSKLHMPQSMHQ